MGRRRVGRRRVGRRRVGRRRVGRRCVCLRSLDSALPGQRAPWTARSLESSLTHQMSPTPCAVVTRRYMLIPMRPMAQPQLMACEAKIG